MVCVIICRTKCWRIPASSSVLQRSFKTMPKHDLISSCTVTLRSIPPGLTTTCVLSNVRIVSAIETTSTRCVQQQTVFQQWATQSDTHIATRAKQGSYAVAHRKDLLFSIVYPTLTWVSRLIIASTISLLSVQSWLSKSTTIWWTLAASSFATPEHEWQAPEQQYVCVKMRFLRCSQPGTASSVSKFILEEFKPSAIPQVYAILSHRWLDGEVLFKDIENGTAESKAGFSKLEFCARQAAKDGIVYFWVDTCCINKESSAELSEAINSMFTWYKNATKCYVYLSDLSLSRWDIKVSTAEHRMKKLRKNLWFTRGWTLQELIAPSSVEFFSKEGWRIGDKTTFREEVGQVTGLPVDLLLNVEYLSHLSVDERLTWAAKRHTTVEEDAAYCLLGLVDVSMPLIYGEGKQKAWDRLQR